MSEFDRVIAGEPYRHREASHGPCYVLCPTAWMRGKRVVLRVLPAKNDKPPRLSRTIEAFTQTSEMRRVMTWDRRTPHDWRYQNLQQPAPEPAWARRARELHGAGWSFRRILKELNLKSIAYLQQVLYGNN